MPTAAQDRSARGPFAALLILLGLLLAPGGASAGQGLQGPARLGATRHVTPAAILAAGLRNPLDDEGTGAGPDPSVAPRASSVRTSALTARPENGFGSIIARPALPRSAAAYRARAPPAA